MNRSPVVLTAGALALAMMIVLPSCGVLGGPPGNVQVQADSTGTGVVLLWTSPSEGPPDRYAVYFTPLDGTEELAAETTATVCYHDPAGRTGTYRVEARFGDDAYPATEEPSTVPVFTDTIRLDELNVANGLAGFGWSRVTGEGAAFDMRIAGNAPSVDFYLTDTRFGSNSRPYSLFSPAARGKDQGAPGVIPGAEWKEGWLTDHLPGEPTILPLLGDTVYFDYTDITSIPFHAGCWLPDDHYALVRVLKVDTDAGYAELVAWFQMVPGLRLVQH
ncbi:MAG TPA: hypothetical protein ENN51_09300 [candidate division WOR-3 bacterium]|uniref:Fibronectin type III domain-containing protein n=1 Tax=candidate division WOR-3 bacterium TaxID=2052148 RepID=A0A7V0XG78_UNCW3|nr:hypothetical protein [candidate division WOR-3 bacterium]